MCVPTLSAGTFDPGTTVNGKTVASWGTWNTVPHYRGRDTYYDVIIRFTDGTEMYASSVTPKRE